MKSPREILLQRHRGADAKLEAIQHSVLRELQNRTCNQPSAIRLSSWRTLPADFWREVIQPARRIWIGLAAAWLVVLLARVDFQAGTPWSAHGTSPISASYRMSLREQEQVLGELLERIDPGKLPPAQPQLPRPRTERRGDFILI